MKTYSPVSKGLLQVISTSCDKPANANLLVLTDLLQLDGIDKLVARLAKLTTSMLAFLVLYLMTGLETKLR